MDRITYTPEIIGLRFMIGTDGKITALADGRQSLSDWNKKFFSLLADLCAGNIEPEFCKGLPPIPIIHEREGAAQ